ncbi:hypothetical protein [Rugamonas aquatica]|uniref:Uncharacterized protein n=1 Tax=Rugamonas aquatica TaxID=2743357 RepID=A0A6A7N287_9BURK|nr:hypothetical protein [Rugamonas aquatica]MQA39040.1 hypothetical protein [Rugamonas aquatica]
MSISPPDPISAAPLPAPVRGQKATFSDRLDAFVTWVTGSVAQFSASAANAYNNALEAYNWAQVALSSASSASSSAAAAAASSNAVKWVSGTTYADGVVTWSPITRLSYRRNGAGAGTTDPSIDTANWVLQLYTLGIGGATAAGSVTLLNTSGGALRVAPTGPGYFVTLPDATTMVKGALAFTIHNAGTDDYGVRDFSGTQLGWIRAGKCAVIGLATNATAAGQWVPCNVEKLGVTAILTPASISAGNGGGVLEAIPLDATRTLLLFGTLYAAVYDSSSQTWGTPVLVRASVLYACAVLSAANQVLVASCPGSSTSIQVVALSVSGVAITVNAAATASAPAAVSQMDRLVAVNGGFAFSYSYNDGSGTLGSSVRGVSLSGTTPVIGTERNFGNVEALPRLFVTGTVLRAVTYSSSSNLKAQPYSLAGSTLTAGTAANTTSSSTFTSQLWAFINGNGNLVARYIDGVGITAAAVFKLTGTTEAVSTVQLLNVPTTTCAYLEVSAGKVIFVTDGNTNNSASWNILTDTAGTASAGTQASTTLASSVSYLGAIDVSGTTARFTGGVSASSGIPATFILTLDCSGSSGVLQGLQTAAYIPSVKNNSRNGVRNGEKLVAGASTYVFADASTDANQSKPYDVMFGPRGVVQSIALGVAQNVSRPGNAANEAWAVGYITSTSPIYIKRVEAAA